MRVSSKASISASFTPARVEHDEEVIEHVGGFRDHPLAVLADHGQHRLDRLLAELLGALRRALVEQLPRVGLLGRGVGPVADALLEIGEGELAHAH